MKKKDVKLKNIRGRLQSENNTVALISHEGMFYPAPLSEDTQTSIDHIARLAASSYKDHMDMEVTMVGYVVGDILYEAKVIRTKEDRTPDEGHDEEYWNNRVPKADILWRARRLPQFTQVFSVDVRQIITLNDSVIERDIRNHNLAVEDPDNCDEDIYKIYHHSRVKEINPYDYEYDTPVFGCEFFMYPYELRMVGKGDCDDWGIELASYLITAGVPEWRVRCVVGTTYTGGGHLTVYVLADDLANWHHINSTTPWSSVLEKGYLKLSDFPKTDDPSDTIGIEDVWFSFNNRYAWHAFETHASEPKVKKFSWFNNFRVIPRFD